MRLVYLLLIASIEHWLVTPSFNGLDENAPLLWTASIAVGGGFIFAIVTWIILSSRHPKSSSILLTPTFGMIAIIAFLGLGSAYGMARDGGSEERPAFLQSLYGWPGFFLILAIMGLAFVRKAKIKSDRNASHK